MHRYLSILFFLLVVAALSAYTREQPEKGILRDKVICVDAGHGGTAKTDFYRPMLFLSIHHNATADFRVNFPIIYFHGKASENKVGVTFAKAIAKAMQEEFYGFSTPVSIVSDHTVFAAEGAGVLRGNYGIPGVLSEASFFTNPKEEIFPARPDTDEEQQVCRPPYGIRPFYTFCPVIPRFLCGETMS